MKKLIILLLFTLTQTAYTKPCQVQSPLVEYTGKYVHVGGRGDAYCEIKVVDNELVCTQSWDGQQVLFKRVSGDYFIIAGLDLSIRYLRNKEGKIIQIVSSGTDYWNKVDK